MELQKHWAESLELGDIVIATIRHKTDGSKNKVGVSVIVINNIYEENYIEAGYDNRIYKIHYNELTK